MPTTIVTTTTTIHAQIEGHLLKQFAPVVFFDSRELHFPCSVDYYLSNVVKQNTAYHYTNDDCQYGFNGNDLNQTPLYTQVIQNDETNTWTLRYALFFPSKGSTSTICDTLSMLRSIWCWYPFFTSVAEYDIKTIELTVEQASLKLKEVKLNGVTEPLDKVELLHDSKRIAIYCMLNHHELSLGPNYSLCYTHDEQGHAFVPKFLQQWSQYFATDEAKVMINDSLVTTVGRDDTAHNS